MTCPDWKPEEAPVARLSKSKTGICRRTIYLDSEQEILLKLQAMKEKTPVIALAESLDLSRIATTVCCDFGDVASQVNLELLP